MGIEYLRDAHPGNGVTAGEPLPANECKAVGHRAFVSSPGAQEPLRCDEAVKAVLTGKVNDTPTPATELPDDREVA